MMKYFFKKIHENYEKNVNFVIKELCLYFNMKISNYNKDT